MSRAEFSVATKKAAYARSGGICECGCERPFDDTVHGRPEYDHDLEAYLDGDNSLENCRAIRFDCHKAKTRERAAPLAKARRGSNARKGFNRNKAKIPGSKGTGIRRPLNGPAYRVKE